MDWIKALALKYGPLGVLAVVVLILVAQNAGLVPAAHQLATSKSDTARERSASESQLSEHIKQTDDQTRALRGIVHQLQQNHETNATGLRTLCIISAKSDTQKLACADIK